MDLFYIVLKETVSWSKSMRILLDGQNCVDFRKKKFGRIARKHVVEGKKVMFVM